MWLGGGSKYHLKEIAEVGISTTGDELSQVCERILIYRNIELGGCVQCFILW